MSMVVQILMTRDKSTIADTLQDAIAEGTSRISFIIESSYSIFVVRCLLSCFEIISKLSNHGHLSQLPITMTLLSGLQYIRSLIDYKSLSSTCAIFYCYMCTIKVLVQHRYIAYITISAIEVISIIRMRALNHS